MSSPSEPYIPIKAEAGRVAQVYARAMAVDPLNLWIFPDPRMRARSLEALYLMIATVGVASGSIEASSSDIEGVALWDVPGGRAFSPSRMLGAGALRFFRRAGLVRAMRMGRYEQWAHGLLARHAPPGSAHLLLLAVDPAHQGRGFAGRLLRARLGELDRRGIPSCLETQNPTNVPFYEHLGFRVRLRARVPGSDVGHWVMVREPPPPRPRS